MGVDESNPQAPSKFQIVTRALETVLRRLPRGTTLSVWAFGQAVGERKTVEKPEDTIKRIQEPVAWDPDDADQMSGLLARVKALEPWNETPLVRAVLEAKEDLVRAKGFRTLLVLTDGMDNRFDKDPQFHGKTIPDVLKDAFQDAGVAIRLVGFNFAEGEEEKAYEQFKVIEGLPLPGSFVSIRDADKLAAELEKGLRRKVRYWVDQEDGGRLPEVPEAGLDVSPNGGNDSWFTLPDKIASSGFKVRVQTNRRWQQDISVGPGELLPLQVLAAEDGRHELPRLRHRRRLRRPPGGAQRRLAAGGVAEPTPERAPLADAADAGAVARTARGPAATDCGRARCGWSWSRRREARRRSTCAGAFSPATRRRPTAWT